MTQDKQLRGVSLETVVEKRRLDQALNAKEFAVLAGISYSSARSWFRTPGFPVFRGVVFWNDFVEWRTARHESGSVENGKAQQRCAALHEVEAFGPKLSPRAEQLLAEAR